MGVRRSLAAALVAMLIPSCSLLTSLEGFSNGRAAEAGATAAEDGGGAIADANIDSAAPDASDGGVDAEDAGPNLFTTYLDGTFENGCPGGGYNSTITVEAAIAHGGTQSCRVCSQPGANGLFTFDEWVDTPPIVGARYRAEAWVRTAPSATPPLAGVFIALRTFQSPPFVQIDENETAKTAIDGTWQVRSVELDATQAAPHLDVFLGSDLKGGTCFLVDDVAVHRIR